MAYLGCVVVEKWLKNFWSEEFETEWILGRVVLEIINLVKKDSNVAV
jgi:hypothetical protein